MSAGSGLGLCIGDPSFTSIAPSSGVNKEFGLRSRIMSEILKIRHNNSTCSVKIAHLKCTEIKTNLPLGV